MKNAFLFPGQGSQKTGMGTGLFEKYPFIAESADEILGYSIADLCLKDDTGKLNLTQYTQPALFTVNALHFHEAKENGLNADFAAGHSLGEYNALYAGKAISFETGLKLVAKRGEIMSKVEGGGMAAIIGLSPEDVTAVLKEHSLDKIDIANYNSPAQVVISGKKEDVVSAEDVFKEAGAKLFVLLNVSGAFHSSYMQEPAAEFATYVKDADIKLPEIPVIANVDAKPYNEDNVKENLIQQMFSSVMWTNSILYIHSNNDIEFHEVGPGKVLRGLNRKIL